MLARPGREGQHSADTHERGEAASESVPQQPHRRSLSARLGIPCIHGRLRDGYDANARREGELIGELVTDEDALVPGPTAPEDTPLHHFITHQGMRRPDHALIRRVFDPDAPEDLLPAAEAELESQEAFASGILDTMGIPPIDTPPVASPACNFEALLDDPDTLALEGPMLPEDDELLDEEEDQELAS